MNNQEPHLLCRSVDIGEGESRGFCPDADGQDQIFIVRLNGQLAGWKNACPHINGAPMAWKKDAYLNGNKTHIVCFAHGALFEPDTGLCFQGPCKGKHLTAIKIVEQQDGQIIYCPDTDKKNEVV